MLKVFLSLIAYFVLISPLISQSDTTELDNKTLPEVVISGFESQRKLLENAGSFGVLSNSELKRFDETSIVKAFNTVPGVRLEQRSPGSFRVAIRGSSLRAPFGVRNVKVYWNNIPLTDPDGGTPLNWFNTSNFGASEIVKGPSGSVYGAGNGGTIIFNKSLPKGKSFVEVEGLGGSFGLRRYGFTANLNAKGNQFLIDYRRQASDGYRDHTELDRQTLQISGKIHYAPERAISFNLFYTDYFYELPGGLTEDQLIENRRQSRPGSIEQNASINIEAFLGGVTHEYRIAEHWTNSSTLYGTRNFLVNPFNFNFERQDVTGIGGRTVFKGSLPIGQSFLHIQSGAEYQQSVSDIMVFDNDGGEEGDLRTNDEITSTQYILFAQAEWEIRDQWIFTAGLSFNKLDFDIDRLEDVGLDTSFMASRSFDGEIVPRFGVVRLLGKSAALHGSVSFGFSPPSLDEIVTSDGAINLLLEAEQGTNFEIGLRGAGLDNRITYDLTGFFFNLDETIVREATEVVTFSNAGETRQNGFESLVRIELLSRPLGPINKVSLQNASTFHNFQFLNFVRLGEDFSGNDLPGVAPVVVVNTLDIESEQGIYLQANHNYTSRITLDDGNTVFAAPYHRVSLKLGYENRWKDLGWDIAFGIDNLTNDLFSLGNDLNAFGNRFFQPAPERNYFGQVKIKVLLRNQPRTLEKCIAILR